MRWLFATGIGLDISGALMVLGAILTTRPSDVAQEAGTFPGYNDERLRARVRERQYAVSGAALLVLGFLCQLGGYAWTFSSWWMFAYAPGVALAAGWLVFQATKKVGTRFPAQAEALMRKIPGRAFQ